MNVVRLLSWRGLMEDSRQSLRTFSFFALLIVSAALTFMQLGFIGIGDPAGYVAYALALLAPVAVGSLLLGVVSGSLYGLATGAIFYAHARLLPLDVYERYFTTPLSSVLILGCAGLALGIIFAFANQRRSKGAHWALALLGCLVVSLLVTFAQGMLDEAKLWEYWDPIRMYLPAEYGFPAETIEVLPMPLLALYNSTLSIGWVRAVTQFALMAASYALAHRFVTRLKETAQMRTVRTAFRLRLLAAVIIAFLVASSVGFVAVTLRLTDDTYVSLQGELVFLKDQLHEDLHTIDVLSNVEMSEQQREELALDRSLTTLLDGYDAEADATLMAFTQEDYSLAYSNNQSYPPGMTADQVLGTGGADALQAMAETGEVELIPWADKVFDEEGERVSAQLAYVGAIEESDYTLALVTPFSHAYAHRGQTMMWVGLVALALLATLYVVVSRLLERVVARPIDGMITSLAKIVRGDLDAIVGEVETVEFAALSAGINVTVDSLKRLIEEAERRTELDLVTARSIQEGALPRTFPAFPGNEHVDLFARMDPARYVGGDFYDFFEVDEHTVAFLIADVSGKGIPASLFMMAAKNEVENCMRSGLPLAEAIGLANDHLCAGNEAEMFVTAWMGTLDWECGRLTYVNAGHNPPLRRHDGTWEWLERRGGPALGVFEGVRFREQTLEMAPGDEVLLYTDGVNEAFNEDVEEYGNDRLLAFLSRHPDTDPQDLVVALRADVAAWAGQAEQSDDVTLLAVKYQ